MNYSYVGVLMDETPGEVSLTFKFTGCPVRCKNCQAKEFWDKDSGVELDVKYFIEELSKNHKSATAVLFMGGEWNQKELIPLMAVAKAWGYKLILYTGLDKSEISDDILLELDYIKYGPYIEELGPINEPTTNQVYENLKTGENMNHYFINNNF